MRKMKLIVTTLAASLVASASVAGVTNAATSNIVYAADTTVSTEPTLIVGDANGDGIVDGVDASLVLSTYAKLSTDSLDINDITAEMWYTYDVNGNSVIDGVDASAILSHYAAISVGET